MIIIEKIKSLTGLKDWYNVYIDKTLILHNLKNIDDILKVLQTTNEKYKINEVIF